MLGHGIRQVSGASWNGLERVVLDNPAILYVLLYGYPSDPSYGLDYWGPPRTGDFKADIAIGDNQEVAIEI